MAGRSTASHILALRRLIEGVKHKNLPAVITYIDFRKAFDSIHRGKMIEVLRAYDIPEELVTESVNFTKIPELGCFPQMEKLSSLV